MHVVECPHCHLKSKVARAVVAARMKCNRCGERFVGSSVEAPDPRPEAPARPAGWLTDEDLASPAAASGPAEWIRPARPNAAGPVTLGITAVAGVGTIVLLGILIYVITRPAEQRPAEVTPTGKPDRPAGSRPVAGQPQLGSPEMPPDQPEDITEVAPPEQVVPAGDPKLDVSWADVKGVGRQYYACGRVLNKYDTALEWVEVTAYLPHRYPVSEKFHFVPPGAGMPYSIRLAPGKIDESALKVVARCQPAAEGMVIWSIDLAERPSSTGQNYVWAGRTWNSSDAPLADVKILVDYFDSDGVYYGTAEGKLDGKSTLGVGKPATFRVSTTDFRANHSGKWFVRAVGRRY